MMAVPKRWKPRRYVVKILIIFCVAVWFGTFAASVQPNAATTERIVTDYHTGLAISGFDPVAYFTEGKAMAGRSEFETTSSGATCRFINEGNREAFLAHSEVYTPVFGGYDPTGVARGIAAPGHPEVWLIVGDRLYLFRNVPTRAVFEGDPEHFIANAQSQWPSMVHTLVQ